MLLTGASATATEQSPSPAIATTPAAAGSAPGSAAARPPPGRAESASNARFLEPLPWCIPSRLPRRARRSFRKGRLPPARPARRIPGRSRTFPWALRHAPARPVRSPAGLVPSRPGLQPATRRFRSPHAHGSSWTAGPESAATGGQGPWCSRRSSGSQGTATPRPACCGRGGRCQQSNTEAHATICSNREAASSSSRRFEARCHCCSRPAARTVPSSR